jgi:hypothetical protein
MSIKELDDQRKEFIKTYTARELFDLVFTDYKNAPSELAKIPNLENLAKERVSQLVNATGIPAKIIEDFFEIVQEVKIEAVIIQEEAAAVAAAADASSTPSDSGGGGG